MRLNPSLAALPSGYLFREIEKRAAAYEAACPEKAKDLLRLGIGDVTRPLSSFVARKMARAAEDMATAEGFRGYGPDGGYPFCIRAVLEGDYGALGIRLSEEELFLSDGAKSDTADIQELLSPDARVAVEDPVYPVYVDSNAMAGRLGAYRDGQWEKLVYLPCRAENGFAPPLPPPGVEAVYLCSPNNPTGAALRRETLEAYVDWALKTGALIVYDAAYRAYVQSPGVPRSIYEIPGARGCAVECCSLSKTAGFTGVRFGYMAVPREVTGRVGDRQVALNGLWRRRIAAKRNGVSYPVQAAAAAVFTPQGQAETRASVQVYMENARCIRTGLQAAGLTLFGGEDAPYVWVKTPRGLDSWGFFDLLLNRAGVLVTPGAGFGPSGEGYVRLTAFNTPANTRLAVARIAAAL